MNDALVALLFGKPRDIRRRFEEGFSPLEVLENRDAGLVARDVEDDLRHARELISSWEQDGIRALTCLDNDYPAHMRSVFDYPLVLFTRGRVAEDLRSVAVVGSREVSDKGLQFAADAARLVVLDGVTVVSGLARGVDGSAHRAALAAGGRTVAVLGNGVNYVYPREHAGLQADIAETGLVVSQYLPDERPTKRSFPARNVTMSAYSSITMIVEAAERSGTKIQADAAIQHGRPLILTRQVATETTWGRQYSSGAYDVEVVVTPGEARRAVERILDRQARPALVLQAG
jgi:DNA processing protein